MRLSRGPAQLMSGQAPLVVAFAGGWFLLMATNSNRQGKIIATVLIVLLLSWAALSVIRSGVYLFEDHLLAVKPVGSERWERTEIRAVIDGDVLWGRSIVHGIELELTKGRKVDLPLSYYLTAPRRREWIQILDAWLEGKPISPKRL